MTGPRAGALGLTLLALAASATSAKPASRTYTVRIAQMAYGPTPATLRVGDVIEWRNADIFRHTATARDGSFDVDLQPKASARTVMRKAGRVSFYCRFHPGMTRTLEVK